jgi:hypothetical protein
LKENQSIEKIKTIEKIKIVCFTIEQITKVNFDFQSHEIHYRREINPQLDLTTYPRSILSSREDYQRTPDEFLRAATSKNSKKQL